MKSKIHNNGGFKQCLFAILLLCQQESSILNPVSASHITSLNDLTISSNEQTNQRGILDRAVKKIKQKEEQEQLEKNVELLQQQDNFLKASRQAILVSHEGYGGDKVDAQMMLNNLRMGGNLPEKTSVSYDDQIKKIASKQDEYKDEYEGFGSLTEMITHQENLAASLVQDKDEIAKTKAKMTEALDNSSVKKIHEEEIAQMQALKEAKAKAESVLEAAKNTVKSNSTSNDTETSGKLSDQQVAQVIDEVSIEQDASQPLPGQAAQAPSAPVDESYDQGFIGKYTQKQIDKDKPKETESSSIEEEQQPAKPKKGMRARFEERVALDQKDQEKAQEVVQKVQHAENLKKKSVLERETERIVREQHDELSQELATEGTGSSSE